MFDRYLQLFGVSGVIPALLAVFVSALPIGMAALVIILSVQHWTGSLVLAAALTAVFSAANGVGLLLQGWVLSRLRPQLVIMSSGIVSVAGIVLLIIAGSARLPVSIMVVAVLITGLAVPAVTTAVRAWLPMIIIDDDHRRAGYALLAVLFQTGMVLGPLVITAAVTLSSPVAGLALLGSLLLAASLLFSRTGWARSGQVGSGQVGSGRVGTGGGSSGTTAREHDRRAGVDHEDRRRWWPGLAGVLSFDAMMGMAAGTTSIAVPGVMLAAGNPAGAGVVASGAAVGTVLGALAYGSRRWPWATPAQLRIAAMVVAATGILGWLVSSWPWWLVLTGLLGGLAGAPVSILLSARLDEVMPPRLIALGYAGLVCAALVGMAAGQGLAAALVDRIGVGHLLLLAPLQLLITVGVAQASRFRVSRVDRA